MKARFSSMVPNASSVAARRIYGDFGAPLPLVVVVVSDIDFLTKYSLVICRKISGVGWIGRGGRTAGEQPESEAVQVTLLHGFLSGHLHGSNGVVALVLVWVEIDKPAGAFSASGKNPPIRVKVKPARTEIVVFTTAFPGIRRVIHSTQYAIS